MATTILSQAEFYELFKNTAQTIAPELTDFTEGATNDAVAGATSIAGSEIERLIIEKFNKTFVETSHGPEVTGGPDDLETLLVDHFGNSFARPAASKALGVVTFSRPNTDAGTVVIPIGTVVKTKKNANGEEFRFATLAAVTMTGLTINASVEAIAAGKASNAGIATVIVVESALTDPTVVVTNAAAFSGGAEKMDDASYREYARNKIEIIRGATLAAIKAAADNVAGVENVTVTEKPVAVKEWDVLTDLPIGNYFYIPYVKCYIADANGAASQPLIDAVQEAIYPVRAAGVVIEVLGATGVLLNWSASITLNISGPNYAELASDPKRIKDTMAVYLSDLGIGDDFVRVTAAAYVMAIWGPAGSNDITAFSTVSPVGDVATSTTEKLVPGTMSIV